MPGVPYPTTQQRRCRRNLAESNRRLQDKRLEWFESDNHHGVRWQGSSLLQLPGYSRGVRIKREEPLFIGYD